MLDWFSSFGNFLQSIISFIIDFFRSVIDVLILIFKAVFYVYAVINYMPLQYKAVLLAIVSFSVIVTIAHFGE